MPPALRALEEGASAGDEQAALGPDYTDRVMTLLGMGHRLFVPRLLAVRDSYHVTFTFYDSMLSLWPFGIFFTQPLHFK